MAVALRNPLCRNVCRLINNHEVSHRRNYIRRGEKVPSVNLYLDTPNNAVNAYDLFKGKRGVLFSVLGAFTPGCKKHIPDYLDHYDQFKAEGYDLIVCVAVNDPYVMSAWAKSLNTKDKILMLADPKAEFTKAMNMDLDCRHIMGTTRSKRYSVVVEDSKMKGFNMEPEDTGLACLLCIQNMKNSKD
ncbi:peroxiredoxin-5, mitochondrial-like [Ruditapes philippinarum]|uniref:peroxiredoxin-5, mitochondrial-like n=1 Tax=Ruditapes philippinarum TaxID=129788 RepID=UPI00295BD0B1|nr:peroxiredoxin-5, mitochondrial-like [Ruditapes philippinarum]